MPALATLAFSSYSLFHQNLLFVGSLLGLLASGKRVPSSLLMTAFLIFSKSHMKLTYFTSLLTHGAVLPSPVKYVAVLHAE